MSMSFEFNGSRSDDYGIVITRIEENDTFGLNRDIVKGERNKYRVRENHFGTIYNDNLSFTISVMKTICNKQPNELLFTSNEIRKINAWLTSPQLPKIFHLPKGNYYDEDIFYFVIFTEVTNKKMQKPYELTYNVTCDSPYGYTEIIKHSIVSSSTVPKTIVITNNSDEREDYIYPLINITPKDHGNITIKNITDADRHITINSLKNDSFYIDCQCLKIYDITNMLISFEDLGVSDIDSIYWPRLCAGENKLEFTGNAQIEISYRELRKVGVF